MNKTYVPTRRVYRAHQVVWEMAYGPIPDGYCVHHRNLDHADNRLENLELIARGAHTRLHCAGKPKSPEHRAKLSEANKGNQNWKGKHHSQDAKDKIAEAKKGRTSWNRGISPSPDTRARLSLALTGKPSPKKGKPGKPASEETRRKLSESHKGKPCPWASLPRSAEYKQKMSEKLREVAPMRGKHHSEETRQKLSEALKGRIVWNKGKPGQAVTPETKQRLSAAALKQWASPEMRQKMSEAQQQRRQREALARQVSPP